MKLTYSIKDQLHDMVIGAAEAAETGTDTHAATAATEHTETSGIAGGLAAIGFDGKLLAAQILNFFILVFVLRRFVYTPLVGLMEKRREQIAHSLEKAETIEKQYAEFEIEHEKRINKSKAEAREILDQAKQAAESLKQETIAATQAETEKMLVKAQADIEQARAAMFADLKQEIGQLVVHATSKIIGKQLDDKTRTQLIDEAVKEVK